MLVPLARRTLTIRSRFEPTRMGREFLRVAYEMAVPIRRVRIRESSVADLAPRKSRDLRKRDSK